MKRLIIVCAIVSMVALVANAVKVSNPIELTNYFDSVHDLKGNTLAIKMVGGSGNGGGPITEFQFVLFDKKRCQ